MRSIVEVLTTDLFPELPAFRLAGTRGEALLESALAQPRWPQYRTAQSKAAALHFSLNKNHAYIDGNKRIAVTAMEWFLLRNSFQLFASNEELVEFALAVASNETSRDESERWITHRAARWTWPEARWMRWYRALPPDIEQSVAESLDRDDPWDFARRALLRQALADFAESVSPGVAS